MGQDRSTVNGKGGGSEVSNLPVDLYFRISDDEDEDFDEKKLL